MKKHRKPETGFGGAAYIARVSASRIKTLRREALERRRTFFRTCRPKMIMTGLSKVEMSS